MSRIDGNVPPTGPERPEGPGGAGGPQGPDRIDGPQDVGAEFRSKLEPAGATPAAGADAVESAAPPSLERMQSIILEGVRKSATKDEILTSVIENEVRVSFADRLGPTATEAIVESFRANDELRSLFHRLYESAIRDAGS